MFKILKKLELTPLIYYMEIQAPRIAASARPGQFIIVRTDEKAERIPLTICDCNVYAGTVAIVFQVVGESTKRMADFKEGEAFIDFAGPLGQPSQLIYEDVETLKTQNIIFVAGGVGAAPVYPQIKWLHNQGIKAEVIIGSKSKETIIFQKELKEAASNIYICTDDGSIGYKGLVTDKLKELIKKGNIYNHVIAIGPMMMMKFISKLTKLYGIKTTVSLNPIMIDGTGMCGACRVTVGNEIKFACTDGPEFDGHLVDFDEAIRRQTMYKSDESREFLRMESSTYNHKGFSCGGHS